MQALPSLRMPIASAAAVVGCLAVVGTARAQPARVSSPQELARAQGALVAPRTGFGAERELRAAGGRLISPTLGIWRLPGTAAARLTPALAARGALRYAEPDRARRPVAHMLDPYATSTYAWHFGAIGADLLEPPGVGFPITVIDSGLDLAHMDFVGRPDTVALNAQNSGLPDGEDYHGTFVASTAAAALNGVGAEGVYPAAALRVYDMGTPTSSAVIAGIDAAIAAGPSVINLSVGGPGASLAEYDAVLRATKTGSLVVAASGNSFDRGNPAEYPADFPHVLTAGAADRSLLPAFFSSSAPGVDLLAPGVDIPVAHPTDPTLYAAVAGTSFASPIVVAAAAWVKTVRPELTVGQVADVLRTTARDVGDAGRDDRAGFGLLSLPAALAAPAPALDRAEPNDDVDEILAGRVFPNGQSTVNGTKGRNTTLAATLDGAEDPHDVYRVVVPAKRKVTVSVKTTAPLRLDLWGPSTLTTWIGRAGRIAVGTRNTVVWTNRKARPVTVFLHLAAPVRSRPTYTAAITLAAAPR